MTSPVVPPRLRASDQDRHEAILALSDHHADGRLDLDEFTARMERAQEATYVDDLDPLFVDLPARRAVPAVTSGSALGRRADHARAGRHAGPPPWAPVVGVVLLGLTVAAVVAGHVPWWLIPFAWFLGMRFVARRHARRRWPQPARRRLS